MDSLSNPEQREALIEKIRRESEIELGRSIQHKRPEKPSVRSSVEPAAYIPKPPRWGPHVVRDMPLDVIFQYLAKNELFRLSWGAKNTHGDAWEKLKSEFEDRLDRMRHEALQEKWLNPQGIYGYWPAQSEGDDLIIYDPISVESSAPIELMRFSFPRQPSGEFLCLADYFTPVDSGIMDVVAFQIVTIGEEATRRFEHLQGSNNYSEAYFVHGLAVQTAEATAEYLHRHIRRELNIPLDQGKRYSWGYPAIPELNDHKKVFELLPAENELGMSLTPAYQLVPEQSTAAIVIHHPQAKYYNIGESRVEQLMREK